MTDKFELFYMFNCIYICNGILRKVYICFSLKTGRSDMTSYLDMHYKYNIMQNDHK